MSPDDRPEGFSPEPVPGSVPGAVLPAAAPVSASVSAPVSAPVSGFAEPGRDFDASEEASRRALAQRLAERNRQRELRAERLARLRGVATPPDPTEAAEAALEDFLRALAGTPVPAPLSDPAALLAFARPEPAAAAVAGDPPPPAPDPGRDLARDLIRDGDDLRRLPGVGPGLVWALERAGVRRLADMAPLAPADLAARLGPLGRLVPADAWIATARAAIAAG